MSLSPTSNPSEVNNTTDEKRHKVLFVCGHNAGRSQMAEAFTHHLGSDRVEARSAGTAPSEKLNQGVVLAMREVGIDMGSHIPKQLTPDMYGSDIHVYQMG